MSSRSNSPLPPAKRQKVSVEKDETPVMPENTSETRVGITEFLNADIPGFSGVLKQRYTDFLVNEIDPSGNVVHLKHIGVQRSKQPVEAKSDVAAVVEEKVEAKVEEKKAEEPAVEAEFKLADEDREFFLSTLGEASLNELLEIHAALKTEKEKVASRTIKSLALSDKEQRSKLHQSLRRVFESKFDSSTGDDGTIVISVMKGKGGSNRRDGKVNQRKSREEKYPNGEHLHFTLWKENRDTMDVLSNFGRILNLPFHVRNKTFAFAGTKDRRAVTVQRCSAYRLNEGRLASLNKPQQGQRFVSWRVGDFEYSNSQLELGELKGNEFTITLRRARLLGQETTKEALSEVVTKSCEGLERDGYINYFGTQRFGTFNKGTHDVGRKILQSDWYGAIREIMDYDPLALTDESIGRDDRDRARALDTFFQGDINRYREALQKMPRKFVAENSIINQAQKAKLDARSPAGDWYSALLAIPRNLRTMYAHSYQSYVWNIVASERIKRFGKKVVKGDLVLVSKSTEPVQEFDEDGDPIIVETSAAPKEFIRARAISQEEADSGKFSLDDVLLSTPGFDVEYPDNELKEVYKSVMAKDNLNPDDMRRNQKEFSLPGSYRSLIGRVIGSVEHEIKELSDNEQAVETDVDILKKGFAKKGDRKEETEEKTEDSSPKDLAVVIKFKLGTSMYATIALRELMKAGGLESYTPEFSKVRGTGGAEAAMEKKEDGKKEDVVMEG